MTATERAGGRTWTLARINTAPEPELAAILAECNAAPEWVAAVLGGRPYRSAEELLTGAARAVETLGWPAVRRALDAHPRIGERASGEHTAARWSRAEQAGIAPDGARDAELARAVAEGNAAYERRFGHVFLIRAVGRGAAEILAELRRRLANGVDTERAEVTRELAEITSLRLRRLLGPGAT